VRYWLDTEFIEYPCTIDLISVGLVAEDGQEFYAESAEVDWSKASPWVLDNVRPHLTGPVYDRTELRDRIREFIGPERPELWGYFCDYDWVAFCWLFGSMVDLPPGWPMYAMDIKQWAHALGSPRLPEQGKGEHHALADARWNRSAWQALAAVSLGSRR